ncbi:MAG: MarR family winged helix-turn-helix transcriptional regulator [Actinomycetota bacterium]|nr:MarR family winged helix-turn-helix transcriptional regulator [Actinomycetota bacterium]
MTTTCHTAAAIAKRQKATTAPGAATDFAIDHVVEQWRRERPDLDPEPIRVIGRISRLSRGIDRRLKVVFDHHGLRTWEYDLLAALRRMGPPHEVTAGELLEALMITSGAVTNRIDRLEDRGLVERTKAPDDKRVVRMCLTEAGHRAMDAAVVDHLDNEAAVLGHLSPTERDELVRLLRAVGRGLDDADPAN